MERGGERTTAADDRACVLGEGDPPGFFKWIHLHDDGSRVPLHRPAGPVEGDVAGVAPPVPTGQLLHLQGEVPQRGGARAPGHPVEVKAARFHPVLRDRQLPGGLGSL